jgi:beta-galactosidase
VKVLILKGGSIGWITGSFDALDADCSYAMKFKGKNSKLTVFANGHMLGRVWLYENNTDFVLAGGRTDVLYLPNCWLNEMQNDVAILAEALKADEDSEIGEVEFECV